MFAAKPAASIPEDELKELCRKKFEIWQWSDFMTFCRWKQIWKPGEPLDECHCDARCLWRAMIRPWANIKEKKNSGKILEDLKRTTISIPSSEFLFLRRRGRLDHLGGESELEMFIAFNKSPVAIEAVGFARQCVNHLTLLRHADDNSKSFSLSAKQGIGGKIRELRGSTAAGDVDATTSKAVSDELEKLADTCSEVLSWAYGKEGKGKRGDIHTVANLVKAIGSSLASADKSKNFSYNETNQTIMMDSKEAKSTASSDTASTVPLTSVRRLSVISEAIPKDSVVL
jgi:hypothetical protein